MPESYYFEELAVVERTPIFNLSSIYPLTDLRNVITGTPSQVEAEYILQSGDKIETAEFGRYIPGYSAQAGIGIRVQTAPTGSQVLRWGLYDDQDGFFFEQDADGVYVGIRRDGTDTRIAQSDWNVDTADGTGPAGIRYGTAAGFDLDTSKGNIYQIVYTWYGFGQIEYQVLDNRRMVTQPPQRTVPVHRLAPTSETSVENPNLPLRAENIGAGDGELGLAGRQYSIIGRYAPERRTFSKVRSGVSVGSGSWTPIIAFRRRDDVQARKTKIRLAGLTAVVDAKMRVAAMVNPTITFGTVVGADLDGSGEAATEFSVNPSGFSVGSGEPVLETLVGTSGAGGTAAGGEDLVGFEIPVTRRRPCVIIARTLSGTGNVDLLVRVDEEW